MTNPNYNNLATMSLLSRNLFLMSKFSFNFLRHHFLYFYSYILCIPFSVFLVSIIKPLEFLQLPSCMPCSVSNMRVYRKERKKRKKKVAHYNRKQVLLQKLRAFANFDEILYIGLCVFVDNTFVPFFTSIGKILFLF